MGYHGNGKTTYMANTLFERLLKSSTATSTARLKIDSVRPCKSYHDAYLCHIFYSEVLKGYELVLRSCLSHH